MILTKSSEDICVKAARVWLQDEKRQLETSMVVEQMQQRPHGAASIDDDATSDGDVSCLPCWHHAVHVVLPGRACRRLLHLGDRAPGGPHHQERKQPVAMPCTAEGTTAEHFWQQGEAGHRAGPCPSLIPLSFKSYAKGQGTAGLVMLCCCLAC